jgi:two-component system, cell cycle response regulator
VEDKKNKRPVGPTDFEIVDKQADRDRTAVRDHQGLTTPSEPPQPCFIVISGSELGRLFKLERRLFIGRAPGCEICLDDEGISRQHALVDKDEAGHVVITDLNSTNGTFFNGARFDLHVLQDGDRVQIGTSTILKFTFQDQVEEQFHTQQYEFASKDALTGLYNKKFFMDQLQKDFSYAVRHAEPTSLIIFDIDEFKSINDTHGHVAGDMVLRNLALLISASLRTEDLFARIGGEEFAVVLRGMDEKRGHLLAGRIRRAVETARFTWKGTHIRVTISLGVTTLFGDNYVDPAEFLRAADEFMYEAKSLGRNRVAP